MIPITGMLRVSVVFQPLLDGALVNRFRRRLFSLDMVSTGLQGQVLHCGTAILRENVFKICGRGLVLYVNNNLLLISGIYQMNNAGKIPRNATAAAWDESQGSRQCLTILSLPSSG